MFMHVKLLKSLFPKEETEEQVEQSRRSTRTRALWCVCIFAKKQKKKAKNNIHTMRGDITLQSPSKKKIKKK